ncbi:MAG TPA: metalloregulator ArsR/SmtB family transcription factor [Solirubrobacteraceae bacterium]|jgi:DNA-binding transcriptional ArsR family regulator|nr:metalloregulator ArsR/SmtB family transcription factor [Solirubrobacteraceae bacterium]
MLADADLAKVAGLIGDPHRAGFLLALVGGGECSAGELAQRTGASTSLASGHLSKLLAGGLVAAERRGRNRYYRLARPEVAQAIEGLLAVAPARAAGSLRESTRGEAIRRARTCYDHFAGRLGVALTEGLGREGLIRTTDAGWSLTEAGRRRFEQVGLDIDGLERGRRTLIRPCLDWTERRPHVAGALGASLADRILELGWVTRLPQTRAVLVTPNGARQLRREFAVELGR